VAFIGERDAVAHGPADLANFQKWWQYGHEFKGPKRPVEGPYTKSLGLTVFRLRIHLDSTICWRFWE
jgi:hypothetical protein